MTAADALGLLERLVAAELVELSKMVPRIVQYGQKARSGVDEAYRDALALSLHAFYTATEKVLERIAREVDGALPRGPEWHRDLLLQVGSEFGDRPAVISRETLLLLDEYRGFRHLVRNLYPFSLDLARLINLAERAPGLEEAFRREIQVFLACLREAAEKAEGNKGQSHPG